jgi:hypothetical protein
MVALRQCCSWERFSKTGTFLWISWRCGAGDGHARLNVRIALRTTTKTRGRKRSNCDGIDKMNAFRCLRIAARPASSASTLLRPRIPTPQRCTSFALPSHNPYLIQLQALRTLPKPPNIPPLTPSPHPPCHISVLYHASPRHLIHPPLFLRDARPRGQNLLTPRFRQHADPVRTKRYIQPESHCAETETWVFEPDQDEEGAELDYEEVEEGKVEH